MIICDTREQKNDHILRYFDLNGIEYRIQKLDTGDYMLEGSPGLTIDRKRNLAELCGNLFSNDRGRFWREVRRAKETGIQMIVLVEHGGKVKSLADVKAWKGKYTRVTGTALYNEICRVSIAYGVEFKFCSKKETAKQMISLLSKDKQNKQMLKGVQNAK